MQHFGDNERLTAWRLSLAVDARLAALTAKTQACVADIRAELASQLALLSTQARAPHQAPYDSALTRWLPLWC